jgi:hypothetical protein
LCSLKAYDRDAGVEVALHEIATDEGSAAVMLPSDVQHENLMRVLDHWSEDGKEVYVTEIVVDGTVEGYVNRLRGPDVKTKVLKKWGRQILSMLDTLHQHKPPVVLGDIRPDNIFINSSDGSARVAALRLQRKQSQEVPTARGRYSAPDEAAAPTPEGDIYSFGLTLLQLASQANPYWVKPDETFQTMWEAKRSGQLPAQLRGDSDSTADLKAELKDFITQCLHMDANQRPSAEQLLQHAWLKKKKRGDKSSGGEDGGDITTLGSDASPADTTAPCPANATTVTKIAMEHTPESGHGTGAAPSEAAATHELPTQKAAHQTHNQDSSSPIAAPTEGTSKTDMPTGESDAVSAGRIGPPCPLVGITLDSFSYRGLRRVSVQISLFYEADSDFIKYRSLKFQCSREEADQEIHKVVQELIQLDLVREEDRGCLTQWLEGSLGRVLREPLAYTRDTVACAK